MPTEAITVEEIDREIAWAAAQEKATFVTIGKGLYLEALKAARAHLSAGGWRPEEAHKIIVGILDGWHDGNRERKADEIVAALFPPTPSGEEQSEEEMLLALQRPACALSGEPVEDISNFHYEPKPSASGEEQKE